MLNISPSLLLLLNADLSIIDVNTALLDFFSLDKQSLIGQNIEYSLLRSFFDSELIRRMQETLDSREQYLDLTWTVQGEERKISIKITPTIFENGHHGVIFFAEDITELTRYRQNLEQMVEDRSKKLNQTNEKLKREIENHKKARARLKKSEQKYRELVENAHSLIIQTDKSGAITFFNEYSECFLGYSEEELMGQNIHETILPITTSSGGDTIRPVFEMVKKPDMAISAIGELRKKDGSQVWISYTIRVMQNFHGDGIGILFIGQDFSERRLIEEKLMAIINFLPDPTFVIDTTGVVIAWNHAMETLTGVTREEIIGAGNNEHSVAVYNVREPMLIDYALHPDQIIPPNYFNCQRNEQGFFAETYSTHLNPDGICLWGKASPLYDSSGDLIGAIESLRDVTRLKKT